jgi:NADP-dependent aldehyde dehydrogenase
MGSTNPVIAFPEKLTQEAAVLAQTLASSVTLGVGQFCTSPGLLLAIKSDTLDAFKAELATALSSTPKGVMLNESIGKSYERTGNEVRSHQAVTSSSEKIEAGAAATVSVSGADFMANPELHHEVFGPFIIVVECADQSELSQVVDALDGQLTGSILATDSDLVNYEEVINSLREKVGRIIYNGMPTGVEVCPAMHHGGPYPSSSNGRYTSVGYDAITRFTRPVAFQSWPNSVLPEELKDSNPKGISRLLNGELTNKAIE